jgi:hypothetical protein
MPATDAAAAAAVPAMSPAPLPSAIRNARTLPECPKFKELFGSDFRVMDTFGKGSCFFHAWAAAVCAGYDWVKDRRVRETIGVSLRESVCKYANEELYNRVVEKVRKKYAAYKRDSGCRSPPTPQIPPFSAFRERLRNKTVWADLVMISFVAYTFGYNLLFWSDDDCAFYYGCDRLDVKKKLGTVLILWHNHSHFELIIRVAADGAVQRQFFWPKDRELLERIEQAYNQTGRASLAT